MWSRFSFSQRYRMYKLTTMLWPYDVFLTYQHHYLDAFPWNFYIFPWDLYFSMKFILKFPWAVLDDCMYVYVYFWALGCNCIYFTSFGLLAQRILKSVDSAFIHYHTFYVTFELQQACWILNVLGFIFIIHLLIHVLHIWQTFETTVKFINMPTLEKVL